MRPSAPPSRSGRLARRPETGASPSTATQAARTPEGVREMNASAASSPRGAPLSAIIVSMTEVASALLLPDFVPVPVAALKTVALYWEQVDIPTYKALPAADTQEAEEWEKTVQALEAEGVVRRYARPVEFPPWQSALATRTLSPRPAAQDVRHAILEQAELDAVRTADMHLVRLADALELSDMTGRAPVATGWFSHLGSLLPPRSGDTPIREGAVITAAVAGIGIDADVPVDDLLRFRERHAAALGRFRAALVDLASSIREGAAPLALLEQARALVSNRVEPALGDLEDALKEGRIRFFWKCLVSASAVASSPVTPTVAVSGAARFSTRSLEYAFDRRRLVREHPYGYLHSLNESFAPASSADPVRGGQVPAEVITDPSESLRDLMRVTVRAYIGSLLDQREPDWIPYPLLPSWRTALLEDPSDVADDLGNASAGPQP